jgi:squalene-hopene/tetraprenyl-beta-curcumene cyclase
MIDLVLALSLCADWSPRLAADYLDGRQKEWFAWKTAQTAGGPCISCHTGVTYLLVRPELRRKLGETEPTSYETGLLRTLHSPGFAGGFFKEPLVQQTTGVQRIHSALLTGDLQSLWPLQITQGKDKGAWNWFHLELDPWEMPESTYYGATLAAIAIGADSSHPEQIALLKDYLRREYGSQPMHNKLTLLWASTKMPGILPDKKNLVEEIWKLQQPDGGWTMESLGPWKRPSRSTGSDAYATGLATYALLIDHNTKGLQKALNWLKSHQDRQHGFWASSSMNKDYPADSMMVKFMQDAATGFAALALLEAEGQVGDLPH